MKACGIIVEYNPFHNGHYYHLHESKKITNSDLIIAVMSGNFLQRGEPALVSKWSRTKMALVGGADLVVELPYVFATQKAELFATGAISLLNALGVTSLCFGSEVGDVNKISKTVQFLEANEESYNHLIKSFISKGNSYPKSTSLAFEKLANHEAYLNLSQPNNILGFHYIKALMSQKSTIKPYTIRRKTAQYHDSSFQNEEIASATSIRKAIEASDNLEDIRHVVPKETYEILLQYKNENKIFHTWEVYYPLLQYKIITTTPDELKKIYEVEEGIEFRLINAASTSSNFQMFMSNLKTKRYTWTRLQRICTHILNNILKTDLHTLNLKHAHYIRILGMSKLGQEYLNKQKKHVPLPIIPTVSKWEDPMLEIDIKAAAIYALAYPKNIRTLKVKEEYSMPPIRFDKNIYSNKL